MPGQWFGRSGIRCGDAGQVLRPVRVTGRSESASRSSNPGGCDMCPCGLRPDSWRALGSVRASRERWLCGFQPAGAGRWSANGCAPVHRQWSSITSPTGMIQREVVADPVDHRCHSRPRP